jgi:hypothetical protein
MSDFTFNPRYITKPDDFVIEALRSNLAGKGSFEGIGLEKQFNIKFIGSESIKYVGATRGKGKVEELTFIDIKNNLRTLRSLSKFNTGTEILKEKFTTSLFRQRANLFAVLLATEIIIPVEEG